MTRGSAPSIVVRGRFEVRGPDGREVTPVGARHRGLLALLAFAPQRRRSRIWLRGMLWSQRGKAQAQGSLRRVLDDLKAWPPRGPRIVAWDRHEVWLTDAVAIDRRDDLAADCDLLETADVADPAFRAWLDELRAADRPDGVGFRPPAPIAAPGVAADPAPGSRTAVVIRSIGPEAGPEAAFLMTHLVDTLASRLETEGAVDVHSEVGAAAVPLPAGGELIQLELAGVVEEGWWTVHLRALAGADRRFLWAGRLRVPMDFRRIFDGPEIPRFVSTALTQVLEQHAALRPPTRSPFLAMRRAAARLFTADRASLALADRELAELSTGDGTAVALAWRAFLRLTRALEFAEGDPALAAEALELASDAARLLPQNPLVCAIAARVQLKLVGDVDRAHHFAQAALRAGDRNPYAYNAAAEVEMMRGDARGAYEAARRGRLIAEGLPHAFAWDIQVCLTALGLDDLDLARQAARAAHAQNPAYRPALRYLVALDLLRGDRAGAERHVALLRELEPGFEPSHLRRPDYPAHTLRATGHAGGLPEG